VRSEIKIDGRLNIHRVFVPFTEPKKILFRALRYMLVTLALFLKALVIKTDVIFVDSTPPSLGFIGILLKRIKRVPAVYSLQDLFPDSLINQGNMDRGLLTALAYRFEQIVYRHMDKIVTPSCDFKRQLINKGIPENKIEVLYNWTDENVVYPVPIDKNILVERYGLSTNAFYITYCGNLGHSQNLELLIDAAISLGTLSELQIVIIGNGVREQELQTYACQKEASKVIFLPFQPYQDISHVFSLGHVGVVISKNNIGQSSFPSKTWSIMSAARPVLACFDTCSELCKIIGNSNSGICIAPDDFEGFRDAIVYLYKNREKAMEMGLNGREFVLNYLTRKAGTDSWYKIFEEFIAQKCNSTSNIRR